MATPHYSIELPADWRRKYLTRAEQAVVELAAGGLATKEIARRLDKSTNTAKNQLNRAMQKLGVCSRYELIARLHRPAPLPPDDAAEADSFAYAI